MASGAENTDAAVAAEFASASHDGPLAWYGDSAYSTGELRAAVAAAGCRAVIKPKPLLPPVPGGFTVDDADGTVTCPAGTTRRITPGGAVNFKAACHGCPLRQRCTTAAAGRNITLHEHDALLRVARAEWLGLRQDYKAHRPNIERTVAHVATRRGLRLKLSYRGVTRNDACLRYRTAALNLRNLVGRRPDPPRRHLGPGHLTRGPERPPHPAARATSGGQQTTRHPHHRPAGQPPETGWHGYAPPQSTQKCFNSARS